MVVERASGEIVGESAAHTMVMAHHYTPIYLGFNSRLASHICGATRCNISDVFPSWKPVDVLIQSNQEKIVLLICTHLFEVL